MQRRIDIKLGYQCNNFCRFCIAAPKRNKAPDKSAKEVKTILEKARNRCNNIIFMGGEPTIQKNLIDYIKYAKALNYQEIHIASNGRMLSLKDYCKKLSEAGANVFTISVHGSSAKIHDYLTRAKDSWNQSIKGIKNLKKLNRYVQTNTVIVKQNYKDLPALAKKLTALCVDKYQFAFMHISPIIQEKPKSIKEMVPRYFQVENYVKKGLQIGISSDIQTTTEAIPYCFMKGYEDCISEKTTPDTDIYDLGTIQKNFKKIRKETAKARGPNCKKCKYYAVCEGPWKDYPEIFGWDEFKPIK